MIQLKDEGKTGRDKGSERSKEEKKMVEGSRCASRDVKVSWERTPGRV